MKGVKIAGIGVALPDWVVSNDEIARLLLEQREKVLKSGIKLTPEQREEFETNDEWIVARTGINERRFAKEGETTSDYAAKAGHEAWTDAYGRGLVPPDFLLLATVSPDHFTTPSTSVITHRKMGIPVYSRDGKAQTLRRFIARDITQACTSFMMALHDGHTLIANGDCERGIVNGADLMTRVMSWHRRSPFVILGDAAGAIALEETSEGSSWFSQNAFFAGINGGEDGEFENFIINRAGGATLPTKLEHLDPRIDKHMMYMNGNEVFKRIVKLVADEIIPAALAHAGLSLLDIDVFVLHQANFRMTEAIVGRLLKAHPEIAILMATLAQPAGELFVLKSESTPRTSSHTVICYNNIDRFGNTTSASVPLCLWEARDLNIIAPGKRVLAVAFGGGFSWASVIIEWGGRDHPAFRR